VAVANLELGMFVCELDRPWSETNFAFQGFPLLTPDEMRAVRECCLYVYVDDTRRVRLQHGAPAAVAPRERKTPQRPQQPLASEIEEARAAYRDGSELIEQVLADVQHGRVIDTRACHGVVKRNLASMLRNESAMLWLIRLKSKDLYTSLHCLSVSIMAMGFGNHLGLADDKLQLLGMAGLLHDVGKMRIDPEILNKPGKLTAEEFDLIKRHPAFGLEALQAQPGIPQAALQAAYGHHERLDGTGYPLGSGPSQIAYMTRIITIVDAFDAITSHRAYDYARPVQSAFEILRSASGRQFDEELVREFIRWLGAFPVGTLVELHTGEVAGAHRRSGGGGRKARAAAAAPAGRGAARCGKAALHAALSGPGADHRGRGGHALSHLRWAARWLLRFAYRRSGVAVDSASAGPGRLRTGRLSPGIRPPAPPFPGAKRDRPVGHRALPEPGCWVTSAHFKNKESRHD